MKLAFLIGSVINLNNGDFTYMKGRGIHSPGERARQTAVGLNSIFCKYPNAKVFLIEASLSLDKKVLDESGISDFIRRYDVELYHMNQINYDVCKVLNEHKNKSYCECLHLKTFIDFSGDILKEYDMVVKLTGRYAITASFNIDSSMTKDDILFRRIHKFENPNNVEWAFPDLLIPGQELTDARYTFAMTYAFGGNRIDDFKHFLEFIMENTKNNGREIEMLIQYWIWKNGIKHKEMDWNVCGYTGNTNLFVHK